MGAGVQHLSKRPGVVHVVDGPDLAAVPPAAALMNTEDLLFGEDTLMLQGCARALPGSTMTGYWSLTGQSGLEWNVFAEGVPLEGETIALPFKPPFGGRRVETVALRVDVDRSDAALVLGAFRGRCSSSCPATARRPPAARIAATPIPSSA